MSDARARHGLILLALLYLIEVVQTIRPPQHDLAGTSRASLQRAVLADDMASQEAAARRLNSKDTFTGRAAALGDAAEGADGAENAGKEGDATGPLVETQEQRRSSKSLQRAAASDEEKVGRRGVVLAHPAGWHEDDDGHQRGSLNEEPPEEEDPAQAIPPWFQQPSSAETAVASEAAAVSKRVGDGDHRHGGMRHLARRPRRHGSMEEAWLAAHRQYVREAYEVDRKGAWDVIFYGDSIIEEWRGTFMGAPWGPFHDVRNIWDEYFGHRPYKAHSMGIASDGVTHLAWRLRHGEVPFDKGHRPKIVILHAGTNDIVGNCTASQGRQVAEGFQDIVEYLHSKLPTTHIVIMAILPKGEIWPNRCSAAIETANLLIQDITAESEHLHYIDVGQAFLSQSTDKNKFEIKEALMPDSMHPSTVGMRIIATRLEPVISKLLMSPLGKHSSDALAII